MNASTENAIFAIWNRIAHKTSCDAADRIIAPLTWFVSTGRCSGHFIQVLNEITARQASTIAARLMKFNGTAAYDDAIASVRDYLNA